MDENERFLKTLIEPKSKTAAVKDEDLWKEEKHSDFENVIIEEQKKRD